MKKIKQAVILAGGQGTRLRPLTLATPKPLIPVHGKPFAEYLIELLKKNGIEEILFLAGYLAEQFPETLGDGSRWGIRIRYSQSPVEDDTGTRLRKAKDLIDDEFLLMYGDNYWPLNLQKLQEHHERMGAEATVVTYDCPSTDSEFTMQVEQGRVRAYDKTRQISGLNAVDAGFIIMTKAALAFIPEGNTNFEQPIYDSLITQKKLAAYVTSQLYWSLTSVELLPRVERALNPARKVLFLDRDGTINVSAKPGEYVTTWEEFIFLPGALDAMTRLAHAGYELYVFTNQAGVARNLPSEENLNSIHLAMQSEFAARGIVLTGIYYCPHASEDGCTCRKPQSGMLYQAAREHDIDLTRAAVVGDSESDKEAGDAAGATTILVSPEEGVAAALPELLN